MTRLSVHLEAQKKIAEIRTMIEAEAKKLTDATEAKDNALRELATLAERKARMNKNFSDLELKIKEAERSLQETIERKDQIFVPIKADRAIERSKLNKIREELKKKEAQRDIYALIENKEQVLASLKEQTKQEKKRLAESQKVFKKFSGELGNLLRVSKELQDYVDQGEKFRNDFHKEEERLGKSRQEYKSISTETEKQKQEIAREKKELDTMREYVSDFYGKVASYVRSAKETLEYVNEQLEEKGTPVVFRVPEGEIIEVNLDNFDKEV